MGKIKGMKMRKVRQKMDDMELLEEEMDSTIVLTDENGEEVEMELLDIVEYKEANYAVLLPLEDEDDDVVILEVAEDENDPEQMQFASVESEETLAAIFEIFKDKFKDEFDFA